MLSNQVTFLVTGSNYLPVVLALNADDLLLMLLFPKGNLLETNRLNHAAQTTLEIFRPHCSPPAHACRYLGVQLLRKREPSNCLSAIHVNVASFFILPLPHAHFFFNSVSYGRVPDLS